MQERLEKLNRAYGLFNVLQFAAVLAGVCTILFTRSGLYVFILFGHIISMIFFGIVTTNLIESTGRKIYPDEKLQTAFYFGPGGFNFKVDWGHPLYEKARKSQDQLLMKIFKKQRRMWILMILGTFGLAGLASVVYF